MDFNEEPSEQPTTTVDYKEELLRLAAEKRIKHTEKFIQKASDETLEKIYNEYQRQELDAVNEQITNMLITKFSELMKSLEAVKDSVSLENDLAGNELFKRDVKRILGVITPYIPYVGIISGGVTIGAHVVDKKVNSPDVHACATRLLEA